MLKLCVLALQIVVVVVEEAMEETGAGSGGVVDSVGGVVAIVEALEGRWEEGKC